MFAKLNLTARPTHLDASGDWHQKANPQSEGLRGEAVNPVWRELSKFTTQIFQSPSCPLSSITMLFSSLSLPSPGHLPTMGLLSQGGCQIGTAQGCPILTLPPEGAGRHENTGPASELWTSHDFHPLAIWDYSGPKEFWLPENRVFPKPYHLQVNTGVGLQMGLMGEGLLNCLHRWVLSRQLETSYWKCKGFVFSNMAGGGEGQGDLVTPGMHTSGSLGKG